MRLQAPNKEDGSLLETLLLESMGALRGGAMFAWANVNGVRSLLEDEVFAEFLQVGEFSLLVGTDLVTDPSTVSRLQALESAHPNLSVRAFVHGVQSMFHPKVAWFEHADHMSVVVGSGNLTLAGLKSNWEVFTVRRVRGPEIDSFWGTISSFYERNADLVFPLAASEVAARAKENLKVKWNRSAVAGEVDDSPVEHTAASVLVAEIPRSGARWAQANFSRAIYEEFFGAKLGSKRRVSLFHVGQGGDLGPLESRPSVEVRSRNYRFELAAAKGFPYPESGAPIGVFLRLESGVILYSLLMPNDHKYTDIQSLVAEKWTGGSRDMRRVVISPHELKSRWMDSPLWRAPHPEL